MSFTIHLVNPEPGMVYWEPQITLLICKYVPRFQVELCERVINKYSPVSAFIVDRPIPLGTPWRCPLDIFPKLEVNFVTYLCDKDGFRRGLKQLPHFEPGNGGEYQYNWATNTMTVLVAPPLEPPPPPAEVTLTVHVSPRGTGTVDCSPAKDIYTLYDAVILTALGAEDYRFDHWSGDLAGSDNPTSVAMASDKYIIANFTKGWLPDIPIISDIIQFLLAELAKLKAWLIGQFQSAVELLKAALLAVFSPLIAPILAAVNWLKEKLLDAWTWLKDIWAWLSNLAATISSAVSSAVISGVAKVWEWITEAAGDIKTWVTTEVGKAWGWITTSAAWVRDETLRNLTAARDFLYDHIIASKDLLHALLVGIPPLLLLNGIKIETTGTDIMGHQDAGFQGMKDFVATNIADPILDAIKNIWTWLGDWLKQGWKDTLTGIKRFFTETLPDWFRTLWDKIKAGAAWVRDKVTEAAGRFLDNILDLVKIHSPILPEGGLGMLRGVVGVAIALAGGLGLMTVAGNLVHPLHSLGLEHISAMIYDMTNYKMLIGAGMGVIAAASIRTPLTYHINSILRPNLPGEGPASEMYNRELISFAEYSKYLSYRGYPDFWHKHLGRITETPIKYFGLAAVARGGYFDHDFFEEDMRRGGYAPDTRAVLLEMYAKSASESVRGIMSGTAISRFKEGFTDEPQFQNELLLLGYSAAQFPTFLAAAKLAYAYDYLTDLVTAYRDAVRKGNLSLDNYRGSLLALGMVPERVEGYILKERARLKPAEPLTPIGPPTPTYETDAGKIRVDTIRRQRRKEIISHDQEVSQLQFLGMDPGYARAIADNDDIRLTKAEE